MKNILVKYKNLDFQRKVNIITGIIAVVICKAFLLFHYTGYQEPTVDDIKYTTGIVKIVSDSYYKRGERQVLHIKINNGNNESLYLTCNYSISQSIQYSGCNFDGILEDYRDEIDGKFGEVSWYVQKQSFGFQNKNPQLLSLKIMKDGSLMNVLSSDLIEKKIEGSSRLSHYFFY